MAIYVKVGTFSKSTSASPASQSISWSTDSAWPVNTVPNALLMWSEGGQTSGTWVHGVGTCIGFSDSARTGRYFWAGTSDTGAFSGPTSHTGERTGFVQNTGDDSFTGQQNTSLAAVASYDTNGFTLTWSPNQTSARLIHYLAFGNVSNATYKQWTINPGTQTITSVGFCSDLLINITYVSSGDPGGSNSAEGGFGMANHDLQQFAMAWANCDSAVGGKTNSGRYQSSARMATLIQSGDASTPVYDDAELIAMTSDGFQYFGRHTSGGIGVGVSTLCLKGIASNIGVSNKPTGAAPVTQSIALSGLTAVRGILLASDQNTTSSSAATNNRFGLGAWDGVTQAASVHDAQDEYISPNAGGFGFFLFGNAHGLGRDDRVFIKVDNSANPGPDDSVPHATFPNIDAEAVGSSLTTSSADISWTTNDAVGTEMAYCVFGEGSAGTCDGGGGGGGGPLTPIGSSNRFQAHVI